MEANDSLASSGLLSFVDNQMKAFKCPAHDLAHCLRVANLSKTIAMADAKGSPRIAFIAGLLHDLLDSKLVPEGQDSSYIESELKSLLEQEKYSSAEITDVVVIIKSVGYKNRLKPDWNIDILPVEYQCVNDADMLDAIGAIGIARCFAFGGKRGRPIFPSGTSNANTDISHAEYVVAQKSDQSNSTDHFFEKLLRIKDLMLTASGMRMAVERHATMEIFLRSVNQEVTEMGATSIYPPGTIPRNV